MDESNAVVGSNIGRVKWFNSRLGYGFITVEEDDIFVHQSNICPNISQFRTLTQGEYVSLNISSTDNDNTRMAVDVTGVNGGPLMCDSRLRVVSEDEQNEDSTGYTHVRRGRGRGRGGRGRGGRGHGGSGRHNNQNSDRSNNNVFDSLQHEQEPTEAPAEEQ